MKQYDGVFQKSMGGDKLPPVLVLSIDDTDEFERVKKVLYNEMFLRYRRPTDKFKKVILETIGDHPDLDEYANAPPDFNIAIKLAEIPDNAMIQDLERSPVYAITILGKKQVLSFYIEKENSLIRNSKLFDL